MAFVGAQTDGFWVSTGRKADRAIATEVEALLLGVMLCFGGDRKSVV